MYLHFDTIGNEVRMNKYETLEEAQKAIEDSGGYVVKALTLELKEDQ